MRTPFAAAAALAFTVACGSVSAQTSPNPDQASEPTNQTTGQTTGQTNQSAGQTDQSAGQTNQATGQTNQASGQANSTASGNQAPQVDNALNPIVVTAARTPQPLANALPQTTVLGQQAIADSGAVDLPSLLMLAPSAEIVTNGPMGSNTSLFMRGADSDSTLVLLDGVRIEGAGTGSAQISQLMLDGIDRVEVVNGNVSALYGSGAVGGVVQIFTKDGGDHPPQFNFQTEYGSYHTQRQTAGVNGALDSSGDTTFNFTVSRVKTDGFQSINPAIVPAVNPAPNGFLDTTVAGTIKHRFNDDWDAGVRFFQSDGQVSFDDAFGTPTEENYAVNKVRAMSAFVDGQLTDRWTTHLIVAQGNDDNTNYLDGQFNGRFNTTNRQLNWQNEFTLAPQNQIVFGYSRLNQYLDSDQYSPPEQQVNSGYVGYNGRFGANQVQLNVRRDQYSDFGGANSYYAGYGYNFTTHWKAIASLSDAFLAPSFNNLYYPDYGNPLLQPERSHSVEAAIQYSSDTLGVMRVTAFQTQYRNLINSTQITPGVYIAENVGQARVQGVETSWSGRIEKTDVRASVTLQNPVDEDTDQILDRRARRFAKLVVAHRFGGWRVSGDWFVSGARTDGGMPLAGYAVLNLNARYDITPSWYVAASVQNLLNRNYELAYSYETPGRGAYITIGWQQR